MPISWPFSSSSTSNEPKPRPTLLQRARQRTQLVKASVTQLAVAHQLSQLPTPTLLLLTFGAGSLGSFAGYRIYKRYFRRLRNSGWVTPDVLEYGRRGGRVKGYVTSVGDADNFRLYHTPGTGWGWLRRVPNNPKELKDQTLHIRIAGVDAPEASHFGRPAQPYAQEALDWLQQRIASKTVYCQLLRKDQYGRLVSIVTLPPRFLPGTLFKGKNLALEMLRAGWVTTYEQAGAEYGPAGKEAFLRIEAQAKAARRGQWASGVHGETPAEYKRRYANNQGGSETVVRKSVKPSSKEKGFLARWFGT